MRSASRQLRRGVRLAAAFSIVGTGVMAVPADAAVVASDFALPIWQGSSGTPGAGHQIDCSSSNENFAGSACTVDVSTVTTGANCLIESVSAPTAVTIATTVPDTPCRATISGPLVFAPTVTGCAFVGAVLWMTWTSGISSDLFHSSAPVAGLMIPTASASNWILKVQSYPSSTDGAHVLTFRDVFNVRFNRSVTSCPGPDMLNLKANVVDAVPNRSVTGSDGYLLDVITR